MSIREHWHAGITVTNLDTAIAFYRDGLGLELRHRQTQDNAYTATMLGYETCHIEIAQMQSGSADGASGHLIELIEFHRPESSLEPGPMHRIATVHVALLVNDLRSIAESAKHHGATLVSDVLDITAGINEGGQVVWMRDPDGVLIELVQPRLVDPDRETNTVEPLTTHSNDPASAPDPRS